MTARVMLLARLSQIESARCKRGEQVLDRRQCARDVASGKQLRGAMLVAERGGERRDLGFKVAPRAAGGAASWSKRCSTGVPRQAP